MSYFPCQKCGKMVGCIGSTIYTCNCRVALPSSPAPTQAGWISVEEKLPRPQQFVLAYFAEDDMEVTWHTGEVWSLGHPGEPTHWMPLPSPPVSSEKAEEVSKVEREE